MSVVTLEDVTPIPREDGLPWTHADMEEAVLPEGPWTTIASFVLAPIDADPTQPLPRSFTATGALDEGWYRVVFKDAQNALMLPTEPIHNAPDVTQPFLPTVSDVGALLLSRTKDDKGKELGTFTANTRPSFTQAQILIRQAADEITGDLDNDIVEGAWPAVRAAISTRAAMLIERSFYSDQVNTGRSVYPQLEADLKTLLPQVEKAVIREYQDETRGEQAPYVRPSYSFPDSAGIETRRW